MMMMVVVVVVVVMMIKLSRHMSQTIIMTTETGVGNTYLGSLRATIFFTEHLHVEIRSISK